MEGFNTFVVTIMDHWRPFNLFSESVFTNKTEGLELSRCQISSTDDDTVTELRQSNGITQSDFETGTKSRGARPCRVQGCEFRNSGAREKALDQKRRNESQCLGSQEENIRKTYDRSHIGRGENAPCVINNSFLNKENTDDDTSAVDNHGEMSFFDIVRKNLRSLEMNVVLRHRRYNKRAKLKSRADFYRAKYNTETGQMNRKRVTDGKPKGISRLFGIVRSNFTSKQNGPNRMNADVIREEANRMSADAIRKEVVMKLEKRKQLYKGKSREEICDHIRGKYL